VSAPASARPWPPEPPPDRPWRVVFMGTPAFAVPSLEALLGREDEVVAAVTQPGRPKGRGKKLAPPPVKVVAEAHGVPVHQPERVRRKPFPDTLAALEPDLIVVTAFGQILPKSILTIPPLGCVNVHASLLPRWRGAAPINRSIAAGDAETGVTTMLMDVGMDTGDMLLKRAVPIAADTTAEALGPELAKVGADLLNETLDAMRAGTLTATPQDDALATAAPLMDKSDGYVDPAWEAERIVRHVHAMTPWPGAALRHRGEPLKLYRARVETTGAPAGAPGTVLSVDRQGFTFAAGAGVVRAVEVQAPGKRRMDAAQYVAGRAIAPGDVLERME